MDKRKLSAMLAVPALIAAAWLALIATDSSGNFTLVETNLVVGDDGRPLLVGALRNNTSRSFFRVGLVATFSSARAVIERQTLVTGGLAAGTDWRFELAVPAAATELRLHNLQAMPRSDSSGLEIKRSGSLDHRIQLTALPAEAG